MLKDLRRIFGPDAAGHCRGNATTSNPSRGVICVVSSIRPPLFGTRRWRQDQNSENTLHELNRAPAGGASQRFRKNWARPAAL